MFMDASAYTSMMESVGGTNTLGKSLSVSGESTTGAYNEGQFEFCGVSYFQWDDGSVELEQNSYIQKIPPVEIPRNRR